jgi:hypothetical protein
VIGTVLANYPDRPTRFDIYHRAGNGKTAYGGHNRAGRL